MTEQGAMAINCSVGGSVENWKKMLLIFQAFFEKQKQKTPQQLLKQHPSTTTIEEPNIKKKLPPSGFLLFQISPGFNITHITLLHIFYHTCMLHTLPVCYILV